MLTILTKVFVIFAIIFIGILASRLRILPAESNKHLVDLLILITSPCMILHAMATKKLNPHLISDTFQTLTLSTAFFILAPLFSLLAVKIMRHTPPEDIGLMTVIMTAVNSGFMGFPVTKALFGDYIFFLIVIANIPLNVYLYFTAVFQMNIGKTNDYNLKKILKSMLNPCIVAATAGCVILFLDVNLPDPFLEFLSTIGDASIPLSMLIVGVQLADNNAVSILKNRDLLKASLINLLLIPAATFLAVNWLPVSGGAKLTVVFSASFPCAVSTVSVAAKEGHNADLAAEGVALTTTLSLITLPIIATFLSTHYGF